MPKFILPYLFPSLVIFLFLSALGSHSWSEAQQKPMVYWCPDRPEDQQYSARQENGCLAVEEEDSSPSVDPTSLNGGTEPQVKVENLQAEISTFLQGYNQFLSCCADDPAQLDEVTDLRRQASALLRVVRTTLPVGQVKLRGVAFAAMLRAVSKTHYDLGELEKRLELLSEATFRVETLDYEGAGRAMRQIEQEREAIRRDFQPIHLPTSAQTGVDIEDTSLPTQMGESIGQTSLPASTGDRIRDLVSPTANQENIHPRTGSEVGVTPPTGRDVGQNPATGFAVGSEQGPTGSTSLPSRAGPAIGDSNLNRGQ